MTRNTVLSLALLAAITGHFALIWPKRPESPPAQGGPSPVEERLVLPRPSEADASPVAGCGGRITQVGRSGAEVAFRYEGAAEEVRVAWPGGEYRARAADVCAGTECRFTLPRPGMPGVQIALDACSPEPVP